MSFQAMAKAVEIKLPSHEKFVLIMLANYADENGKCWPSITTISRETGISTASVKRAIKKLCDRGIISRQRQNRGNIKSHNIYRLEWS